MYLATIFLILIFLCLCIMCMVGGYNAMKMKNATPATSENQMVGMK